jgi:hypothetical protein
LESSSIFSGTMTIAATLDAWLFVKVLAPILVCWADVPSPHSPQCVAQFAAQRFQGNAKGKFLANNDLASQVQASCAADA